MVVIYQAGNFLNQAGQAAAPMNQAVQQVNSITTQRLLQGERLKQREAELAAAEDAAAAKAQRESIEAVQKGLRSALDVTNDLGLGTDYNAFLAIDQELLQKDPEMYRQAVQATGFPKSDTGADYPIALTTRAEMLRSIREREQTGAKSRMADDFASQAEIAGYTPDEVADVVTMAASNAEPAVLAAEIESIQAQADERRKVEMARDVGVAYAQRIKTEHPDLAHNNPDAYAIWTRLASGRSKDPMTDRARLSVMVEHGTESYHAIMADAFALGQAQARQQVAQEAAQYRPQAFQMQGMAPDAGQAPTGAETRTPEQQQRQVTEWNASKLEGLDNLKVLARESELTWLQENFGAKKPDAWTLDQTIDRALADAGTTEDTELGRIIIKGVLQDMAPIDAAMLRGEWPPQRPEEDPEDPIEGMRSADMPESQVNPFAFDREAFEAWRIGQIRDEARRNGGLSISLPPLP